MLWKLTLLLSSWSNFSPPDFPSLSNLRKLWRIYFAQKSCNTSWNKRLCNMFEVCKWDALRDIATFVQFKKREKHPYCTNNSKLRKASNCKVAKKDWIYFWVYVGTGNEGVEELAKTHQRGWPLKDRLQISRLTLSKFQRINYPLSPLKLPENLGFSDAFKGDI